MGKILLVVGASSDMGQALIHYANQRYDFVIAHYLHMNAGLQALQKKLGTRLVCIKADLSREEEVRQMIDAIQAKGLTPSHIVHFPAPKIENQKFHRIAWQTFQREMDISLRSLVLVTQAFLPQMAKAHHGKVVVMLSFVLNGMPPKYCANYIVAKYALLGLMKALAVEYADKGITVNAVSPAFMVTKYISNMHEYLIEQEAKKSPLGRNLVPGDVIPSIAFLLSDAADCINGQNLAVTCGR